MNAKIVCCGIGVGLIGVGVAFSQSNASKRIIDKSTSLNISERVTKDFTLSTCIDSLIMHPTNSDTPTIYLSQGGGYVSGHNNYGDTGKLERFNYSDYSFGDTILGTIIWFGVGKANVDGINDSLWVTVWDSSKVLLQRIPIAYKTVQDSVNANSFVEVPFIPPFKVSSLNKGIYVGITFRYSNGDTVAIVTTRKTSTSGCNAWEISNNGNWYNYCDPNNSWGFTGASHYIFLVVRSCITGEKRIVSHTPAIIQEGNKLLITNYDGSNALLIVQDITGRKILTQNINNFISAVDISSLSHGIYIVSLLKDKNVFFQKIIK